MVKASSLSVLVSILNVCCHFHWFHVRATCTTHLPAMNTDRSSKPECDTSPSPPPPPPPCHPVSLYLSIPNYLVLLQVQNANNIFKRKEDALRRLRHIHICTGVRHHIHYVHLDIYMDVLSLLFSEA